MGYKKATKQIHLEENIQGALQALHDKQFKSIRVAALHFEVSVSTLSRRIRDVKRDTRPIN